MKSIREFFKNIRTGYEFKEEMERRARLAVMTGDINELRGGAVLPKRNNLGEAEVVPVDGVDYWLTDSGLKAIVEERIELVWGKTVKWRIDEPKIEQEKVWTNTIASMLESVCDDANDRNLIATLAIFFMKAKHTKVNIGIYFPYISDEKVNEMLEKSGATQYMKDQMNF